MANKKTKSGYGLNNYGSLTTTVNGSVLSANQINTVSMNTTVPDAFVTVDGDANIKVKAEGSLTIEDKDGTKYDVLEFMKTMSERMLVLYPNFEAHEKYPALKEAYEHYKMLEALLGVDNENKK